ncbi:MAG: polysaccharide pyruvyl transferase family protein [Pseudomonadota bacterium]
MTNEAGEVSGASGPTSVEAMAGDGHRVCTTSGGREACNADGNGRGPLERDQTNGVSKLIIFNVKYSQNLGDGVIAQCLEHELGQALGGAEIVSIDLAGRDAWTDPGTGRLRLLKLAVLRSLPGLAKDQITAFALGRILGRLRPHWESRVRGANVALVGGGQLIQDVDLNFPLKLSAAFDICRAERVPMGVVAVGVSAPEPGNRLGGDLLRNVLTSDLVCVAARDQASCDNLAKRGRPGAEICLDPGLLASRLWPVAPTKRLSGRPIVGLGVTHGSVLSHHSARTGPVRAVDAKLFADLALGLAWNGFDVHCFTNGAGEDMEMLAQVSALLDGPRDTSLERFPMKWKPVRRKKMRQNKKLERRSGSVRSEHSLDAAGTIRVLTRPQDPQQLARMIAGFDAVVAHRLHASIVAYSYRTPIIGLAWDKKVDAFFQSVGLGRFVCAFGPESLDDVLALTHEAMEQGVEPVRHQDVLETCAENIRSVAAQVVANAGQSQCIHAAA